jgi:hypothetical protein
VSLAVYDTRGRRVSTVLDKQVTSAGFHEAPLRSAGWAAGVYYCRLDALGQTLTRKLIVLK